MTLDIQTELDFEKCISTGVALIDFNTPWCAPCRLQEPIIECLAKKMSGLAVVASLNVDKNPNPAGRLDISNIPTMVIFKDGREIKRFVGLQPEKTLFDAVNKALPHGGFE